MNGLWRRTNLLALIGLTLYGAGIDHPTGNRTTPPTLNMVAPLGSTRRLAQILFAVVFGTTVPHLLRPQPSDMALAQSSLRIGE